MRSLLLVRHAESVWNAEGRIQGQRCAGLSPTGFEQAQQVAMSLARRHPNAAVVSSDLPRTRQTADPIGAALGVEVEPDSRLRERHFGSWEGRTRDEVRTDDADRWSRWLRGDDVLSEIGGESAEELAARAVGVFDELLRGTPDGEITIAVTHGGTIWNGVHALLDLPVPSLGGVANTAIAALVTYEDGPIVLDRWNEVAHLDVEVRPVGAARQVADAPPVGR